jgi:hypothetical protein
VWLLINTVPQPQDRLNWKSTAHWNPFAAGQRTAPIWLDTRQVRARQHGIDFARHSNKHCLARQPRAIDTRLRNQWSSCCSCTEELRCVTNTKTLINPYILYHYISVSAPNQIHYISCWERLRL